MGRTAIEPLHWPPLSVASAVLPVIRRELAGEPRAQRASLPVDVCAIVEDGMLGYELAPHGVDAPFLIVGCTADGIPRVRRTTFDPKGDAGLRLATVLGRPIDREVRRARRKPQHAEAFYADWRTAAWSAWNEIGAVLRYEGPQWQQSMDVCRSLENALAIATLHLAEWDPAIDFCGLLHQAEYGFPLRARDGGMGTLTSRHTDLWALEWKSGPRIVRSEFSPFVRTEVRDAALPRDVSC